MSGLIPLPQADGTAAAAVARLDAWAQAGSVVDSLADERERVREPLLYALSCAASELDEIRRAINRTRDAIEEALDEAYE